MEASAKIRMNVDQAFHELVRVIRWVVGQSTGYTSSTQHVTEVTPVINIIDADPSETFGHIAVRLNMTFY